MNGFRILFSVHVITLLFFRVTFLGSTPDVHAQAQQEKIGLDDLESMTMEELELICVERGFELIRDDSEGGGDLTHADYVDAARRCLAIEEDMNEILESNPELADELLSEIDRMKEEKERLERERQKMLAEKESLEQQLLDASKINAKDAAGPGSSDKTRMWGSTTGAGTTASASSPQPDPSAPLLEPEQQSSSETVTTDGSDKANPPVVDAMKAESTAFIPHAPTTASSTTTTIKGDGSATTADSSTSTSTTQSDPTTPVETAAVSAEKLEALTDAITATNNSTSVDSDDLCAPPTKESTFESDAAATVNEKSEFSLKGFIQEVMSEFEKDVHRVTTLVLPVVRPLFNAGNAAWKYMKIIFNSAKRQVEKYRQQDSSDATVVKTSDSKSSGESASTS